MAYIERSISPYVQKAHQNFKALLITGAGRQENPRFSFQVLDKVKEKKRGMGAVISMCPAPGMLRENVLELPVWYI